MNLNSKRQKLSYASLDGSEKIKIDLIRSAKLKLLKDKAKLMNELEQLDEEEEEEKILPNVLTNLMQKSCHLSEEDF